MKFISHRGNLRGKTSLENSPVQIEKCLEFGIECEIDLRIIQNKFYLGHDDSEYEITYDWLKNRSTMLWIHCKNFDCLKFFVEKKSTEFNYFWHNNDDYTFTSKGYLWVFPDKELSENCIAVLPEIWVSISSDLSLKKFAGVCSDYIIDYQESMKFKSGG
jgi:hypothetical protein